MTCACVATRVKWRDSDKHVHLGDNFIIVSAQMEDVDEWVAEKRARQLPEACGKNKQSPSAPVPVEHEEGEGAGVKDVQVTDTNKQGAPHLQKGDETQASSDDGLAE